MIFFDKFSTPHETIPFNEIKNADYIPSVNKAIELARIRITELKKVEDVNFQSFVVPFLDVGRELELVSGTFFNLHSANTSDEVEKIADELSPIITSFYNDIKLDGELFEKVKACYQNRENENLSVEEKTIIEKQYKSFVRNGANLSDTDKNILRDIDEKLSKLSLSFAQNALKATNEYVRELTEEDIKGMPESWKEASLAAAKEKNKSAHVVTLAAPIFVPFLKYCENRDLRKEVTFAANVKAVKGEYSNQENVIETLKLRDKRAKLLGYRNHADFVLEERMAQSENKVKDFLSEIISKAKNTAYSEVKEIEEFAKTIGFTDQIQAWDFSFYSEKFKKHKFDFDDEVLRPYFRLENVINGVFETASKLYGISFKKNKEIPLYHEDVIAYEVYDNKTNNIMGIFYADFFPRSSKRQGAWMTSYKEQSESQIPHVSIVCNFTKSTETKPSLLTFNEVLTLFHEFGHSLHGLLSQCKYSTLSGTNVYWDFVELPSQIMENWAYEKECLDLFAKHYKTGELIPEELIQKIKNARKFLEGFATIRQLSFANLDIELHSMDPSKIQSIIETEKNLMADYKLFSEYPEDGCMSCSFSHIFAGGYSAGYYSYKWAEVLDADAFEAFEKEGIFNKQTATRFKAEILSKGGTEHPLTLYKRFKGAEPSPKALIARAGL